MTATKPNDEQRLNALVEEALADAERRASRGEVPNHSTLNGLRRLIDHRDAVRQVAEARLLMEG